MIEQHAIHIHIFILSSMQVKLRDAIIKENPNQGGGFQGPPDPDFLHVDQSENPDFEGGGDFRIWNNRIKRF